MPLVSTFGALSARGFGFTGAAAPTPSGPYWLGANTTWPSATPITLYGSASDAQGNLFTSGVYVGGSALNGYTAKLSPTGSIIWQRLLVNTYNVSGWYNAVDAYGNCYTAGEANTAGGVSYGYVAKYNSSGSLQWQRSLSNGSFNLSLFGVAVDASLNVYVVGTTVQTGNTPLVLAKYNSSGVLQWQRAFGPTSGRFSFATIALDSSASIYVSYSDTSTLYGYVGGLAKFNTSGTLQWQRGWYDPAGNRYYYGGPIAVNSNTGAVYVASGLSDVGPANDAFLLLRWDSTGAFGSGPSLGNSFSGDKGIALDSAGNVYMSGAMGGISSVLAKFDASGGYQWQRSLTGATSADALYGEGLSIDTGGNLKWVLKYGNAPYVLLPFLARLPSDGSRTGTYSVAGGNFTYGVPTFFTGSLTPSLMTPTYPSTASTFTDAAATFTDSAASLSLSVTTI